MSKFARYSLPHVGTVYVALDSSSSDDGLFILLQNDNREGFGGASWQIELLDDSYATVTGPWHWNSFDFYRHFPHAKRDIERARARGAYANT